MLTRSIPDYTSPLDAPPPPLSLRPSTPQPAPEREPEPVLVVRPGLAAEDAFLDGTMDPAPTRVARPWARRAWYAAFITTWSWGAGLAAAAALLLWAVAPSPPQVQPVPTVGLATALSPAAPELEVVEPVRVVTPARPAASTAAEVPTPPPFTAPVAPSSVWGPI